MKAGDKVKFTEANLRMFTPEFFPPVGTIGTVIRTDTDGDIYVQWPDHSTSCDDCWWCDREIVELVEEDEQ